MVTEPSPGPGEVVDHLGIPQTVAAAELGVGGTGLVREVMLLEQCEVGQPPAIPRLGAERLDGNREDAADPVGAEACFRLGIAIVGLLDDCVERDMRLPPPSLLPPSGEGRVRAESFCARAQERPEATTSRVVPSEPFLLERRKKKPLREVLGIRFVEAAPPPEKRHHRPAVGPCQQFPGLTTTVGVAVAERLHDRMPGVRKAGRGGFLGRDPERYESPGLCARRGAWRLPTGAPRHFTAHWKLPHEWGIMHDTSPECPVHARQGMSPIGWLLLGVAAAGAPLAAQSGPDREALGRWSDSIEAAGTLQAIEQLETASKSASGTVGLLRRALWTLRHGELRGDRMELDEALFNFHSASGKETRWPWPRYGMARALVAEELREFVPKPGNGVREGESNASAIWRFLGEAQDRDPGFGPARDLFLRLTLASGYRDQPEVIRRTLRGYADAADWRALVVLGRIATSDRAPTIALATFDSALARGADTSLVQLERARALAALGRTPEARAAYWASLARPSGAARLEHHVDLWWITSSDSLAAFDALPIDSVESWMRTFWLRRDAENLRAPGERLTEHLRRWNWVRTDYRVPIANRRTEMKQTEFDVALQGNCVPSGAWSLDDLIAREPVHPDDIRKDERFLDHRAIIYMRHGEPMARSITGGNRSTVDATPGAPGMGQLTSEDVSWFIPPLGSYTQVEARDLFLRFFNDSSFIFSRSLTAEQQMDERVRQNESWLYWIDGAYRVLHFTGSQALGLTAPTTLNTILPLRPDLYIARGNLGSSFTAIARILLNRPLAKPHECQDAVQEMMKVSRNDATIASQEDSYTQVFERPFLLEAQFFGLGRAAEGDSRALVPFAIPSIGLLSQGQTPDGRKLVPIRFRLTFFDPETGANRFVDTTRIFATRTLDEGTWLSGLFEVTLPDGTWEMGLMAVQDGRGTGGVARQRSVRIGGPGLALGDIVTGRPQGQPAWSPGGEPIALNPWNGWPSNEAVELWYQVRGLEPGTEYQTTIEIRSAERGGKRVAVDFSDRATGPLTNVRRAVQLKDLEAGAYRLTVTVKAAGAAATRDRLIVLTKGDK